MTDAKMENALTGLVLVHPFFASLAMRMPLVENPKAGTLFTNGREIHYNPEYCAALKREEKMGVLAHECLHPALLSWDRLKTAHHWQAKELAFEHEINNLLEDAKVKMPKGLVCDRRFKGMTAEEIYAILVKEMPPPLEISVSFGEGHGCCDGPKISVKGGGLTEAEAGQLRMEWEEALLQAAHTAKMQGKLPANMERLIESARKRPIDWKAALRRFVQQTARSDYSWHLPSTRYASMGLYLPRLRSESTPPLVVAVDTSGSIGNAELAIFANEVESVVQEVRPEALHVLFCDAQVHRVEVYEPGDIIALRPVGGGGTDHTPVFDWIAKEGIEPAAVICLTDGYTTYPKEEVWPTLWAMTTDQVAPWGETLRIGG